MAGQQVGALVVLSTISTTLTILSGVWALWLTYKNGFRRSLTLAFIAAQLLLFCSDVFRLYRAGFYLGLPLEQPFVHNVAITRDVYFSSVLDGIVMNLTLLLTCWRFHIFSVVVEAWIVWIFTTVIVSAVFYIFLVILWGMAALSVIPIFQRHREGFLIMAYHVLYFVLDILTLMSTVVAVALTNRRAFRYSKRVGAKGSKKFRDDEETRKRREPPKSAMMYLFLALGILLDLSGLIVLFVENSEVGVALYTLLFRSHQVLFVCYVCIYGKDWAAWMEGLAEEKKDKQITATVPMSPIWDGTAE